MAPLGQHPTVVSESRLTAGVFGAGSGHPESQTSGNTQIHSC